MMDETVTVLLSAPAIVALTNIAKDLGLPSKLAPVVAIVLGVGIAAGQTYAEPGLWATISQGVLIALAASGVRDLATTPASEDRAIATAVKPRRAAE